MFCFNHVLFVLLCKRIQNGGNLMGIEFLEKSHQFHLYNDEISYVFHIMRNGQLGNLYFGKRIATNHDYTDREEHSYRPVSAYTYDHEYSFSLGDLRQEYPAYGTGDFRDPAVEIKQENGSTITNFTYQKHHIFAGKPRLDGLPATYVESNDEATTLEITLHDDVIAADMVLTYTIYADRNVIARNVRFVNHGEQPLHITKAMSLALDLPDSNYDWLQFSGAWARERQPKARHLQQGIQAVESTRGASSHMQNPFVILKRPNTTEDLGTVIGFTFVYSGNFRIQAEVDTYDVTRLTVGIHPQNFDWKLNPGAVFQTPEALITFSHTGLNGLSQTNHALLRERLVRGKWRDRNRPVLINNWEATYFNFDEDKLVQIAKKARDCGIELFVLDDGWFSTRNGETSGLGDWWANRNRFPNGIKGLATRVKKLGMKFGLWFEPEMVNKDSELYRNHPDWIIQTPHRHPSHGRQQYVLDFSRPEVVNAIYTMMAKILAGADIDYIKWDMNRNITEVYSAAYPADQQGEIFHRYILGVYSLYERLIKRFPDILFESCASGGGRFDAGMLYYAPQAWTSDCSDAAERVKIQYGTSYGYPLSSMGAHVSITPNHQLNRSTPLKTRGDIAFFGGGFGYELDLNKLTPAEQKTVNAQIRFAKQSREIINHGTFYRLQDPFTHNIAAWMVVSPDKRHALVEVYKMLNDVNAPFRLTYLRGLDSNAQYRVTEEGGQDYGSHGGDELMNAGLITTDEQAGQVATEDIKGDFSSRLFILSAE